MRTSFIGSALLSILLITALLVPLSVSLTSAKPASASPASASVPSLSPSSLDQEDQTEENILTNCDTYVRQDYPSWTGGGTSTTLYVGRYNNGAERAYVKFDLSSVPSAATVIDAKLWLYPWGYTGSGANVQVERVDVDSWTEANTSWYTQPHAMESLSILKQCLRWGAGDLGLHRI